MVFVGAVRRVGHFVSLDDKAESVAEEKSEDNGDENTSRLFSPFLKMLAFTAAVKG